MAAWSRVQVVGKPLQRQGTRDQAAITGIGILSPIGNDAATVTDALQTGRHGIAPVSRFNVSHFRTHLGGEVNDDVGVAIIQHLADGIRLHEVVLFNGGNEHILCPAVAQLRGDE